MAGSLTNHLGEARSIANRVAHSHGLELFDLQFKRESNGWVLRIVIDRAAQTHSDTNGRGEDVTLIDCETVSREVSAVLDAEDAFEHAYTLEVSSPGLDRPLRHLEDFVRFIGRRVKIVTSEPLDGQRFVTGRIAEVNGQTIVLEDGKKTRLVPKMAVARARLEVEFQHKTHSRADRNWQ